MRVFECACACMPVQAGVWAHICVHVRTCIHGHVGAHTRACAAMCVSRDMLGHMNIVLCRHVFGKK